MAILAMTSHKRDASARWTRRGISSNFGNHPQVAENPAPRYAAAGRERIESASQGGNHGRGNDGRRKAN